MSLQNQNENYLGNVNVKRDGILQEWTQESVLEYAQCMKDPIYFAEKYCKVISLDQGLVPFNLYPYQRKMFQQFQENRFNVILACRQSGKSISACAYLLWFALFNPEKTIAILANKGATAREMLSRVTLMLENIPFFLQPGTKALNKGSLEFSNNSRIIAAATSGSSIRGLSATYSTWMSLLLLSVLLSSILLLIQLYLPVKTPRSSLHLRQMESEIRFIKSGKARHKE